MDLWTTSKELGMVGKVKNGRPAWKWKREGEQGEAQMERRRDNRASLSSGSFMEGEARICQTTTLNPPLLGERNGSRQMLEKELGSGIQCVNECQTLP